MSVEIEYNRKVYFDTNESREKNYLLLIRQGSNNCYESNGQRVKMWFLSCYGWNYSVIGKVCERAGSCEGGSLQKADGYNFQYITPENYLALYRQKIKNAKPIIELFEDFDISITLFRKVLPKKEEEKDNWRKEKIDELIRKHKPYTEEVDFYDKKLKTYYRPIKMLNEFYEFLQAPRWNDNNSFYCSFNFTPKG